MKAAKVFLLMFGVLCFTLFIFYFPSAVRAKEVFEPRFAHVAPEAHPWTAAAIRFIKLVEERSDGRIKIKHFHSGSLGDEFSNVDAVKAGSIDFTLTAVPQIASYSPAWQVINIPFLFRDRDHAWKVLDGPIGKELLKMATEKQVHVLAWWEIGMAQFINKKRPINTLEDMKGLKLREMKSKFLIKSMAALGAIPTPMNWGEVYTAIQQGVIDGGVNPETSFLAGKNYEVAKYLTILDYYYSPAPLVVNPKWMEKLPADLKQIVEKTAIETSKFTRRYCHERANWASVELQNRGCETTYPDREPFVKAMQVVYKDKEVEEVVPKGMIEKIRAVK